MNANHGARPHNWRACEHEWPVAWQARRARLCEAGRGLCPERVPACQSQRHAGEPCIHLADHRGGCETEPAPGEKHGFMWWPSETNASA